MLAIGDFSKITHLSIRTLRHYHEVGLLEPTEIDPRSGYRHYTLAQVPIAQVIRRFRDLDMPVERVREVLMAPDLATRNRLIAEHLGALESKLAQTQAAVTSLKELLDTGAASPIAIATRVAAAARGLGIREVVTRAELVAWWHGARGELDAVVDAQGLTRTAPTFGLFAGSLFQDERGEVTMLVPVAEATRAVGRAKDLHVDAAELAVTEHLGAHDGIDITYARLGSHVARHAFGVDGPVRETYVVDGRGAVGEAEWRTEIGWPIFATGVGGTRGTMNGRAAVSVLLRVTSSSNAVYCPEHFLVGAARGTRDYAQKFVYRSPVIVDDFVSFPTPNDDRKFGFCLERMPFQEDRNICGTAVQRVGEPLLAQRIASTDRICRQRAGNRCEIRSRPCRRNAEARNTTLKFRCAVLQQDFERAQDTVECRGLSRDRSVHGNELLAVLRVEVATDLLNLCPHLGRYPGLR